MAEHGDSWAGEQWHIASQSNPPETLDKGLLYRPSSAAENCVSETMPRPFGMLLIWCVCMVYDVDGDVDGVDSVDDRC